MIRLPIMTVVHEKLACPSSIVQSKRKLRRAHGSHSLGTISVDSLLKHVDSLLSAFFPHRTAGEDMYGRVAILRNIWKVDERGSEFLGLKVEGEKRKKSERKGRRYSRLLLGIKVESRDETDHLNTIALKVTFVQFSPDQGRSV